MKLTLILLVLLCDNVEFTLTHDECSELPTVERAFVLDEYKKTQYQKGDVIYFCCDPGYTTGLNTTYVCTEHGWRAATHGQCVEDTFPVRLGCARPPALRNGYVLKNSTYVYTHGQKAAYQCDNLYTMTGGSYKTCTDGQWTGDIQCKETTCELPASNSLKMRVPVGNRITVECGGGSSEQVECLPSGQWSSTFTACSTAPPLDPRSCGPPPSLDNGDFLTTTTTQFGNNARVEYQCQALYVRQGGPYKTCINGEWTGEIRCLSPCTVNSDLMELNKIRFTYRSSNRLYVPHGDHISFICALGTRHDGQLRMRQICKDGVMVLPRCV